MTIASRFQKGGQLSRALLQEDRPIPLLKCLQRPFHLILMAWQQACLSQHLRKARKLWLVLFSAPLCKLLVFQDLSVDSYKPLVC